MRTLNYHLGLDSHTCTHHITHTHTRACARTCTYLTIYSHPCKHSPTRTLANSRRACMMMHPHRNGKKRSNRLPPTSLRYLVFTVRPGNPARICFICACCVSYVHAYVASYYACAMPFDFGGSAEIGFLQMKLRGSASFAFGICKRWWGGGLHSKCFAL